MEIEMEDLLKIVDSIKHLDTLEDTIKINEILKKYNIERKVEW